MAPLSSTSTARRATYLVIGILAVYLTIAGGNIVRLRAEGCGPMVNYPDCAPEAGFPFVYAYDQPTGGSPLQNMGRMDSDDYFWVNPITFAGNVFVYGVLLLCAWRTVQFLVSRQNAATLRRLTPFATIAVLTLIAGSFNFRPYRPGRLPTPTPIPAHITNLQHRWQMEEAGTGRMITLEFGSGDRATLYLPDHTLVGSYTWQNPASLFFTLSAYAALDSTTPLQCDDLPMVLEDACQTSVVAYSGPSLEGRLIAPPPVSSDPYTAPPTQAPVDATFLGVNGTLQVQVDATTLSLTNDAGVQQAFTRAP